MIGRTLGGPWFLSMIAAIAAGCGSGATNTTNTANTATPSAGRACSIHSLLRPLAGGPAGGTSGSSIALGSLGGKTLAYVADEDAKSVIVVDIDHASQHVAAPAQKELARIPLGGVPSQLLIDDDGRVLVTLRDQGRIVSLEAEDTSGRLVTRCSVDAPADAVGIASNGNSVVVTGGFSHTVSLLDRKTLAPRHTLDVKREPRSIAFSTDGATAFVSHTVGSNMTLVDMASAKATELPMLSAGEPRAVESLRQLEANLAMIKGTPGEEGMRTVFENMKLAARGKDSCQGYALASLDRGRIFAPQVFVDPGDLEGKPSGYGDSNGLGTEAAAIAVIDEGTKTLVRASTEFPRNQPFMFSGRENAPLQCLLPRAAAVDPVSGSLLVTCFGIDSLIAYDAASASPARAERKRWIVGAGPTGVAVDVKGRRAVVFAQFDRTLNVLPLEVEAKPGEPSRPPLNPRITLAPLPAHEAPSSAFALGRVLFHASGDARISKDGRACASCHPDGRDDAITWATPQGPRRSILLAGRMQNSAPYSWSGIEDDLHTHLHTTFERLDGSGLRNVELDAIVAYVSALPAPTPLREDPTKVARGRAIFHSKEAACSGCHNDDLLTDNRLHDVKSKRRNDDKAEFNTPSLHLVGGAGPYFHDGRYTTLRQLLVESNGTMGHTKHLTQPGDLDALEAYVRSL